MKGNTFRYTGLVALLPFGYISRLYLFNCQAVSQNSCYWLDRMQFSIIILCALYFPATEEMINCPVGTYMDYLGAQSIDDCIPCTPGYYCLEGVTAVSGPCEEGFYCPSPIANPYSNSPVEIGSYGPRMVCDYYTLEFNSNIIVLNVPVVPIPHEG